MFNLLTLLLFSSLPHFLFFHVYKNPINFRNLCHKYKLDCIYTQYIVCMICRFVSMLLFILSYGTYVTLNLFGILMAIIGYSLILYVWNALGNKGLFYGKEMGFSLPWINSMIFRYIKHPQYIGAIIFYQGISLLNTNIEARFAMSICSLLYVIMIINENK